MVHLTKEQRWSIIHEWKACGHQIKPTAKILGLGANTVRLWVRRYESTGDVLDMEGRGRKALLTTTAAKLAKESLLSKKYDGAKQVAILLHERGLTPKVLQGNTIIRAAKAVAVAEGRPIMALRGRPKVKKLGAPTVQKRLAYCREHRGRAFLDVCFSDRVKIELKYPGACVSQCEWVYQGQSRSATMVNHAKCLNIYACMCVHGISPAVIVAGTTGVKSKYVNKRGEESKNITSMEYEDVLMNSLLPAALKIFQAAGHGTFRFMQDNDPTHGVASRVIDAFNRKKGTGITLLRAPPNSPDLNPIENVWGYLQAKVDKRGCKTFDEFKAAVFEEMERIPKPMLSNLVKSMPRRLKECVAAEGQRIKY